MEIKILSEILRRENKQKMFSLLIEKYIKEREVSLTSRSLV